MEDVQRIKKEIENYFNKYHLHDIFMFSCEGYTMGVNEFDITLIENNKNKDYYTILYVEKYDLYFKLEAELIKNSVIYNKVLKQVFPKQKMITYYAEDV